MQPVQSIRFSGNRPKKQHSTDAGFDLFAEETVLIRSHQATGCRCYEIVGTGTYVAIPNNHVGLICPRSGLAAKFGLTVLNSPGIIDPGYRGELKVPLVNMGESAHVVCRGDRIAQLLIVPLATVEFVEDYDVSSDDTDRGLGGFGSTGIGGGLAA